MTKIKDYIEYDGTYKQFLRHILGLKSCKKDDGLAGWLIRAKVGTKVWLVKEEKVTTITKEMISSSKGIGQVGIEGDDNLWYVRINGDGIDGKPLMEPVKEKI